FMELSRFTLRTLRISWRGIGALLVCGLALAATAISTNYATQQSIPNTEVQKVELTLPSDRNIIVRFAYSMTMALGMVLVFSTVVIGFLLTEITIPLARRLGYLLLHATRSAWVVGGLALLGAVAGAGKDALKRVDQADATFDLHPDVVGSEGFDGADFGASLEARGNSIKQGKIAGLETAYNIGRGTGSGTAGVGFPADFLSMFMQSISIFGYIEEPVFREFSRQLQTRRLLAGECMFDSDGDRDDQSFYVVIDGQVQVYLVDEDEAKQGSNELGQAAQGSQGMAADASAALNTGSEMYDEPGVQYSAGDSGASPYLHGSDAGNNDSADAFYSDDESMASTEQDQQSKAILLNVVGPGDVLSSLFSILSLFAEDVPLKSAPFGDFERPKQMSLPSNTRGLQEHGLADFALGDSAHTLHSVYQQTPATGYSAVASESQESFFGISAVSDSPSHDATGFALRPPSKQHAGQHAEPRARRPNIVARAAADTTLAMIPGNAFQRVARLYPKAAAHILQVILTRLQRVTFATLYDYLNLPHELVNVERALTELAHCPLPAVISQSNVLHRISRAYAQAEITPLAAAPPLSPMFESRRPSFLSSRQSPAARAAIEGTGSSVLQTAWKINHQNMMTLARQQQQTNLALAPMTVTESAEAGGVSRHRRSGSDVDVAASVPSAADIDALRMHVLQQMCVSLGVNPYTPDGRSTSTTSTTATAVASSTSDRASGSGPSSATTSRRSSTHRRALPRTEHLLPLLQTMAAADHRRRAESMQALMDIPSLVDELELYRLPDGFLLAEQG
ncbi:phosphatidylcholine and lysophosphatidylcholine phospholipase, partial [Coemansia sp. RSA 2607]